MAGEINQMAMEEQSTEQKKEQLVDIAEVGEVNTVPDEEEETVNIIGDEYDDFDLPPAPEPNSSTPRPEPSPTNTQDD
jgi:hypothetical protein